MDKLDIIIKYTTEIGPMTLTTLHKILYFAQATSLINFFKLHNVLLQHDPLSCCEQSSF